MGQMNPQGAIQKAMLPLICCFYIMGNISVAVEIEMVLIPEGSFTMGHNGGDEDERPAHKVYLDAYYIQKTEVTNAQYYAFWKADGGEASSHTPFSFGSETGSWPDRALRYPDYPVVGVSWMGASAYAQWMGKRLPTEAEWEKAARGTKGQLWPWGNAFPLQTGQQQTYANIWNGQDGYDNGPAPVGTFPAGGSVYGVLDLAGNVWEWVADWYDASYYHRSPEGNPRGPSLGCWRVLRGGSWMNDANTSLGIHRFYAYPTVATSFVGFRLAENTR